MIKKFNTLTAVVIRPYRVHEMQTITINDSWHLPVCLSVMRLHVTLLSKQIEVLLGEVGVETFGDPKNIVFMRVPISPMYSMLLSPN